MKVHFVGVGGIGISGLARFMKNDGHIISGSDIYETPNINKLRSEGINVNVPHSKDNIIDQDLVIHSAIIKSENPEIIAAKEKGIKTLHRREALPIILGDKKVYSVCGAHGKSTTTAILSSILDSNCIIGAESKSFGSNVRIVENSNLVAFEADESDESFLFSNPYCSIVTNAEPEHMEYYNYDYDRFYAGYRKFLDLAKTRVINCEDTFLNSLNIDAIRLYPSKDIKNIKFIVDNGEPYTIFTLKDLGEFKVWGFGEHIALDASLAILAAMNELNLSDIRSNILNYRGIKKRFDIVSKSDDRIVIDDYGHHPTEIKATLESAKIFAKLNNLNEITVIWQPHKYSRTVDNLDSFINCFKGIDRLVILPVWSAGEQEVKLDFGTLFSQYNLSLANNIKYAKDNNYTDKGLVIGFGAGDITYQLRESF